MATSKEDSLLEPISDEANEILQSYVPVIDPYRLKEFAFQRAVAKISQLSNSISEKALKRLAEFDIKLDYTHDLETLIRDYYRSINVEGQHAADKEIEREIEIESLIKQYDGVFVAEEPPVGSGLKAVDMAVDSYGRRKLHLAVDNYDLAEVRRLVEVEGANCNIVDNSYSTPLDKARILGFDEISDYLVAFTDQE